MKQVRKQYSRSFLLEPTKLTRILDLIHERLNEQSHTTQLDHFEVSLSQNRVEEMSNLEDVLALENSRKRRIRRLVITCSASTDGTPANNREVRVDFGGYITDSQGKRTVEGIISNVSGEDSGWCNRTLSEIEEQIERTWVRRGPTFLTLGGLAAFLLIFLMSQFVQFRPDVAPDSMWFSDANLDRVEQIVSQGRTITDEEMREITTMQLKNILEAKRPKPSTPAGQNRKLIVLGIPIGIVIVCVIILFATCYPHMVFLWGDEAERYANILQRRKALWGIIISVLIVGLLSRLFFEGVSPWIPSG